MIKLSISNIAWSSETDKEMYGYLSNMGYSGLEIAPSRLFGPNPYDKIDRAVQWNLQLKKEYGLNVSSIQSIWYGKTENIFRSDQDFNCLVRYSRRAAQFAAAVNCPNLVFGCPRNRNIESNSQKTSEIEELFFKKLSLIAQEYHVNFGIEANPVIYQTNYLNTTAEVLQLLTRLDLPGIGLNLDVGSMIYNQETIEDILPFVNQITHVHISEPGLVMLQKRKLHKHLLKSLKTAGYNRYISIEMGRQDSIQNILDSMTYIKEVAQYAES